jgi:hypothetical protein
VKAVSGKAALRRSNYDTNLAIRQRHEKIMDDFLGDFETGGRIVAGMALYSLAYRVFSLYIAAAG